MQDPEIRAESFVVRIWLERREIIGALPVWRGMIEHVASGKRQYFIDLDSIVIFMAEYFCKWDVKPKSLILLREKLRLQTVQRWLKRSDSTT